MYIIGISAFYHDASVSLFKDGDLIFACEEEKFTGIKHDSSFPNESLKYIYKKYKIKKEEIEAVCYYENPKLKYERVMSNIKSQIFKNPIYSFKSFLEIYKNVNNIDVLLKNICENVFYSEHHSAHQYYSYYTSPFNDAVLFSIDGVGEKITTMVGYTNGNNIQTQTLSEYPHSVGLFYSAMTSFLGFRPNEGEYKVMGLASYGDHKKYINKVRELIEYRNGKLICNMDVFVWNKSNKVMFNEKLPELLGIEQRLPEEPLNQDHKDLASAIQRRYEEIFFKMLDTAAMVTENRNLCLSGGCAYNGTANGKLYKYSKFNSLWIPPAPSDAGSAIGACIHYLVKNNKIKGKIKRNPFLGPEYYIDEKLLKGKKYKRFNSESKLVEHVAQKIKDGNVVGWYRGRIEFGSRALGNRSILADPTADGMKDRINKVIKKREGFRPFAPMVTKEKQHQFFDMVEDVPYMNQVVKVKPEYINKLKAVTHVDGTARVQTVHKHTIINDLLIEFERITGYPILLNTSFNIKDKTMVLTPKDAIETFYDTDMDILVLNNYIIYK